MASQLRLAKKKRYTAANTYRPADLIEWEAAKAAIRDYEFTYRNGRAILRVTPSPIPVGPEQIPSSSSTVAGVGGEEAAGVSAEAALGPKPNPFEPIITAMIEKYLGVRHDDESEESSSSDPSELLADEGKIAEKQVGSTPAAIPGPSKLGVTNKVESIVGLSGDAAAAVGKSPGTPGSAVPVPKTSTNDTTDTNKKDLEEYYKSVAPIILPQRRPRLLGPPKSHAQDSVVSKRGGKITLPTSAAAPRPPLPSSSTTAASKKVVMDPPEPIDNNTIRDLVFRNCTMEFQQPDITFDEADERVSQGALEEFTTKLTSLTKYQITTSEVFFYPMSKKAAFELFRYATNPSGCGFGAEVYKKIYIADETYVITVFKDVPKKKEEDESSRAAAIRERRRHVSGGQ